MENLKKVTRAHWCLFALLIGFAFLMQNCNEDDVTIFEENQTETELNAKPVKVTVCRFNERKGTYSEVTLLEKRLQPGDVIIDADGDGYATANGCNMLKGLDCDDNDPAITRITSYQDADEDGYGNILEYVIDCTIPSGYVTNNLDCDDTNPALTTTTIFYRDYDGDGFGNLYNSSQACVAPDGYVTDNTDCDDYDISINPDAIEICGDGIDNNCNGETDEGCIIARTYVPDDYFEQALIDLDYDDVLDDYVVTANINTVTYINLNYYVGESPGKIADLTGIEDFTALETLHCGSNNLTSLDLSQNTELITISCAGNVLTSINVSNSANLDYLDCNGNQLTSLNLSANSLLTYLACTGNLLTELDMSANTALLNLQCNLNSIENLNISGCPLEYLYCSNNQLSSLDVSSHFDLKELYCDNNNLSSINVNNNAALERLDCNNNQLISLDVSANIYLNILYCNNNLFTCIKVNQNQLDNYTSWDWYIGSAVCMIDCPS